MNEPRIFTTVEWKAKKITSKFPKAKGVGIVIHNTDHPNRAPETGAKEEAKAFDLARSIQKDHTVTAHNWKDTGQHFTISRGGLILEGRHGSLDAARNGMVVSGAHAGSTVHNTTWYGIELEGRNLPAFAVTSQQWAALVELCAWLATNAKFAGSKILPHLQVKVNGSTDCPGKVVDQLPKLRDEVTARIKAG